jgi:hypothetical protein
MIGVMIISTGGPRYTQFIPALRDSLRAFFPPHQTILFTDAADDFGVDIKIPYSVSGWPIGTLMRYKAFLGARDILEQYDYLFYLDCDMKIMAPIDASEICGDGITAVIHPAWGIYPLGYEKNPKSLAYIAEEPRSPQYPDSNFVYYQGCVQGGKTQNYLDMCTLLSHNIDLDLTNGGYIAIRHDESHLNRYLADHPPAIALDPVYAFPQTSNAYSTVHGRQPRILHLEKDQEWKDK